MNHSHKLGLDQLISHVYRVKETWWLSVLVALLAWCTTLRVDIGARGLAISLSIWISIFINGLRLLLDMRCFLDQESSSLVGS